MCERLAVDELRGAPLAMQSDWEVVGEWSGFAASERQIKDQLGIGSVHVADFLGKRRFEMIAFAPTLPNDLNGIGEVRSFPHEWSADPPALLARTGIDDVIAFKAIRRACEFMCERVRTLHQTTRPATLYRIN